MHPVLLQTGLMGQAQGRCWEESSFPGILPGLLTLSSWMAWNWEGKGESENSHLPIENQVQSFHKKPPQASELEPQRQGGYTVK